MRGCRSVQTTQAWGSRATSERKFDSTVDMASRRAAWRSTCLAKIFARERYIRAAAAHAMAPPANAANSRAAPLFRNEQDAAAPSGAMAKAGVTKVRPAAAKAGQDTSRAAFIGFSCLKRRNINICRIES